jgi:hypothetical protein
LIHPLQILDIMKKLKIFIQTTILAICIGCSNGQKIGNSIPVIDIESNINNTDVINLSEFTNDISYIPLQTSEDHIFTGIWNCVLLNDWILAYNGSQCVLYDSKGNFINSIGTRGRGPGEFNFCRQADFSKDKTIFIQNSCDLLEYDSAGSYIRTYKNVFGIDFEDLEYPAIQGWHRLNDSLFFGNMPNNTGHIKYKAVIINKKGQLKTGFLNYEQFQRDTPSSFGLENIVDLYMFEGRLHYKQLNCDTAFYLDDELKLNPEYVFYLGKYKMPINIRGARDGVTKKWDYIFVWDVFQTEDILLLNCHFGNRFPAKRLTVHTLIPQAGPTWLNTNYMLGVYNKRNGEFKFCKPSNTDNALFTTGIYNDIDGGPRFFPDQMVNDSTMVMFLDAKKFKDHMNRGDFKNSTPKYPEKKIRLEELSEKISEMDNSIMMFVTFKKKN